MMVASGEALMVPSALSAPPCLRKRVREKQYEGRLPVEMRELRRSVSVMGWSLPLCSNITPLPV